MTDRKCLIHEHFVPHPAKPHPSQATFIEKKALAFVSSNDNIPYKIWVFKKKKNKALHNPTHQCLIIKENQV